MVLQLLSGVALAALSTGLLAGCDINSNFKSQVTAQHQPQPTGGKTKIVNPDTDQEVEAGYISAGKKLNFAALEEQVMPINDLALAKKISNVDVTALDEQRRPTTSNPKNLFIRLTLTGAKPVEFILPLNGDSTHPSAQNVLQLRKELTAQPLSASAVCETAACTTIELKFKQNKKSVDGFYTAGSKTAGVLYTQTEPQAQLMAVSQEENQALPAGELSEIEETVRRNPKIIQSSFSTVSGVSKSQVRIQARDLKTSALSFVAPVVDTSEVAPIAESNQYVRVLGIDPETNDMMIEVQAAAVQTPNESFIRTSSTGLSFTKDKSVGASASKSKIIVTEQKKPDPSKGILRFFLINPTTLQAPRLDLPNPFEYNPPQNDGGPTAEQLAKDAAAEMANAPVAPAAEEAPEVAGATTGGLFPTSKSNAVALAQSKSFARFGKDVIPKAIYEKAVSKVKRAIPNTPSVSPYIINVFESMNMTPEFAYIMLIESEYLTGGQNEPFTPTVITQAAKCGTAFGPWQIVNNTALAIQRLSKAGFQYTSIRGCGNARTYSANDDRGYLVQSTYMAAHYLKYLMKYYKLENEPIMAVVGYNQGDSGPHNARAAFFRRFKNYNIDYYMVRKYNMAKTSYADEFLAYREVGQNTVKHKLSPVAAPQARLDLKRISRTGGPVPAKAVAVDTKAGQ